ncbi:hypothetical protein LUZ60_005066 [Juncus effusus]|nr:hypothetical protein LUZ60_005066 [Juncus effusus]
MAGSYRCYVGNLPYNTTDSTLKEAFKTYGVIMDSIVMRDRDTGRSRGFGFVSFSTEKAMNDAIEGMNGQELNGRIINVSRPSSSGGGESYGGGQSN